MLVAGLGTGQVLWALVWSSLLARWLWTVVMVGSDIGRSDDLSGARTGVWWLTVIALPFIGVLVHVVTRGTTIRAPANGLVPVGVDGAGVLHDLDLRRATARRLA